MDEFCRTAILRMLKKAGNKVVFPVITLGLVRDFLGCGKVVFPDIEIRHLYEAAVGSMKDYLGHDLHIGGRYFDAYPSRNLPKYGVLKALGDRKYELLEPFTSSAQHLVSWIPEQIRQTIDERLGEIPRLGQQAFRCETASGKDGFLTFVGRYMSQGPAYFEVFSFAVMKVHLEKFACRLYRDTRTCARDRGVDLSTNYGVVYQIKKLKLYSKSAAENVYSELKLNFDSQRIQDHNVILVIDEISKEVRNYLIDMSIQSISKQDILALAEGFEDAEDREKVLRIIHDEFRREYASDI